MHLHILKGLLPSRRGCHCQAWPRGGSCEVRLWMAAWRSCICRATMAPLNAIQKTDALFLAWSTWAVCTKPKPCPSPTPGECLREMLMFRQCDPPPRKKWCLGTNLHLGGFIKGVLRKKMESFPAKSICCSFLKQEPSSSEDSGSLEPFNIKGLSSRLE